MAIDYHNLPSGAITDSTTYQGQLYLMLCEFECSVPGTPDQTIYDDGKSNNNPLLAHNPTIGVGFNLRAQLLPVMQAYFGNQNFDVQGKSTTYTQDKALMTTLNGIMNSSWSGSANVTAETAKVVAAINNYYVAIAPPGTPPADITSITQFSLNVSQIQAAFTNISQKFEAEVSGWENIPNSDERLALMSLAWNSTGRPNDGVNLLGTGLQSAINNGDRAEAWFQIRYNSNGGSDSNVKLGLAKRRYFESQLFGLYNESTGTPIPLDEAMQTYEMMSESTGGQLNRNIIFSYENTYSAEVNAANTDYNNLLGINVQTLEQNLQPAANTLVQQYLLGSSADFYLSQNPFSLTSIDPRDVQVAATGGDSDLTASVRTGYQLNTGGFMPSLLIAQGGADTLDASGSNQANALIGSTGNDLIRGGNGSDFIVAGSGDDSIVLNGGADTVVLGNEDNPEDGGHDTLDASQDSSNFTCYVGAGTRETILLGSGAAQIYLVTGGVSGPTIDGSGPLHISATWLSPGQWWDSSDDALIVQLPGANGQVDLNASTKNIVITYGQSTSSQGQLSQALSLSQLEQVYAADSSGSGSSSLGTEITLDDFSGSDDDGVDLGAEPPASTLTGSNNLSQLYDEGLSGDTAPGGDAEYVYVDGYQGNNVSAVYGSNSSGAPYGNQIDGDGVASYVSAGDGANTVILGNYFDTATTPTANTLNATIVGGSGDQDLIGVGNGSETITGGALGSDTTAGTYIDGGGATADLIAGGQNSVIFGGTGANDTLVASENDGTTGSSFEPSSALIAGLSFWGDAYSTITGGSNGTYYEGALPEVSWDESFGNDTASIVVDISLYQSNNTFATPFNLLGSSYDSGEAGSTTLPGSLLIGGTGQDVLIGNSGNDTIIGGDPGAISSSSINEALAGGAGSNLIYGGSGNEVIFADMGPSGVTDWADLDTSDSDTVYAGDGTDFIYGSGGNDSLYGGAGTDVINVGNGSSYVDAGSGNSSVYGGTGNDTIIANGSSDYIETGDGDSSVSVGAGQDTITLGAGNDTVEADQGGSALITEGNGAVTLIAGTSTGSDTVQIGTGSTTIQVGDNLDESNLIVRDVNGDLVLTDGGAMALTLQDYFGSGGNVAIQFEDGVTWGAQQILQASMTPSSDGSPDTLVGSNGNDDIAAGYGNTLIVGVSGNNTLTGGEAADTIDGGTGADTIEGGSGTTTINGGTGLETYIYNEGDGSDTIFENTSIAGNDSISFGAGLSASDLSFSYYSPNDILTITDTTSGQTITVDNFVATTDSQHQIAALAFADGTSMSQLQVIQQADLLQGTTGNDSLIGDSLENYIDGLGGNDTAVGEGGNDTFVFNSGYGQLEVDETYSTGQVPVLLLGAGITESSIKVTSDGANLILTDGVSGDEVKLDGMLNNADDGVAQVQFADGTTLTATQLLQMELEGSSGNDTIYGTTSADIIDGKGGSDLVVGDGGSDTFVFDQGYGQLTISENYLSGQQPILQLGSGITASSLRVTSNETNLILTDGISGDQITLDNMFSQSDAGVELVTFADGTSLTAAQLIQMELAGTTGNNTIYGTTGADLIDGKGGTDVEYGDGGNDTFVFGAGYGDLEINETYTSGQQPILELGAGITTPALKVMVSGNNLLLTDGISGDQITLDNANLSNGSGVAEVQLADGTTLTASQLIQMSKEISGTTGNDTLYGSGGADLIDGKGGDDVEYGEGGNDTFVFDAGYGQLAIDESDYTGDEISVLQLGAGITASALHVTTDGTNLFLTDGITGDEIDVESMWNDTAFGVSQVQLADGTTLTAAQLKLMELTGTSGSDTIYGIAGGGLIDGKGGGDYEIGSGGNDTFVFNAGYGHLEINETYANGQAPILELGAGTTESMLHVTADKYNNLYLTDGINGDQIELDQMWYTMLNGTGNYGVQAVQLADGTTLTLAQLTQMEVASGTTGSDTIYGTSDADLLDGKGGNDSVVGNGGNDTFVFDAGYGQLTINNHYTNGAVPVLQLGAGITASSLTILSDGDSLYLTDGTPGDKIILDDMSGYTGYGVQEVEFADGTTLTAMQLNQMAGNYIFGTTGNDTLGANGSTPNGDYIDGKGGNDLEVTSGGNDTFVFNAGYGQLEISGAGGIDWGSFVDPDPVLQLGPGITASNLRATMGENGYLIYLTDGVSGDEITLLDMGSQVNGTGSPVVQLADGTTLTMAQLIWAGLPQGTTGNDNIVGTWGGELIDGEGGNDSVNGEGGSDTFVFDAGYGQLDIIESYLTGQQPVLQCGAGITASDLQVTSNGEDILIADGISGDQIRLNNMLWNSSDGIQVVQFADGTTLTAAQLLQMEMTGTTGNDTIFGTPGAHLLDGKGGNDVIYGGGSSDTFVFNAGYGDLEISEGYLSGQQPVLQLGGGITASALHVASDEWGDLILTDGINGDQVTLDDQLLNENDGVQLVTFADGSTLTAAQLNQMAMTGTTGNDTLYGTPGADVIDGKGGNDSVVGNGGSDTFVFNAGYGDLEIDESYISGTDQPVLQLGAGIAASALHVTESSNNLILTDGVSGDQITLDQMWSTSGYGVEAVQFADGSTLTASQLLQMAMTGTTGNDTLTGTSSADLIDGKGGNDSVVGNGGSDTFVFNSGYGHLTINEVYSRGQTPVLELGAGISASALHATKSGNNLVLTDGVSGDQVTLVNMWSTSADGIASLQLSGGTTLTRAQIIALEMTGTTGNDTITGTSGADLIDGKGGNDSVTGEGGNDTFVFNSGYGKLTINETYTSGQAPVLTLGAGITTSTLKVAKSGNNLVLTDGVTGDQITLVNMSSSSTAGVATVKLANGTSLTRSQLIGMETAIAKSTQSATLDSTKINPLIHAIASYTGEGASGSIGSLMIPPVAPDLMLHSAA